MHNAASAGQGRHRHWDLEPLLLICRILATALAVSFALAAVVLLLATPAQAAEAMKPADAGRGTLLLRRDGATYPAPALHTDVRIQVSGPLARARVVQTFHNPGKDWAEGIYVFPLPENAAVDRLRLKIGERVVEGEIHERGEARKTYDQAKASGQRAALVEQERPNLFTTNVANIGPGQDVVVEIEYQQTLRYELENGTGRYRLRFPMVAGPRYIPGNPTGEAGHGWAPPTDEVPDADRITPPVRHPSEGPINPVHLTVEVDAGVPIATIDSPFHQVSVTAGSPSRRIVELDHTYANRDFELTWTLAAGSAPAATLFVEPGKARDYALLMLVPPTQGVDTRRLPREVVFVIDTSGSMEGTSIVQARNALALALRRLAPGDRFNVIEFNSTAQALFPAPQQAEPAIVEHAVEWVEGLQADGGTEMAAALKLALGGDSDAGRVRQVVFLTDGAVGNEDALFGLIQQRLGDSRLFTVGIGAAPNSHFMRKAAEAGRGTFTYVGKVEEVQEKMSALFAKLESPVLKGVTVTWPDGSAADTWPRRLPDLYLGEPILVAAALGRATGKVRVEGRSGDIRWQSELALDDADRGHGVGVLWARQKIDALVDSLREGADEATVRAAVVALAEEHHLVSKYTSLVAVDKTPARPADAALGTAALPTNLPEGWQYEAVFGELPRGATAARWDLLTGCLALLLAALLWWLQRARPLNLHPEY